MEEQKLNEEVFLPYVLENLARNSSALVKIEAVETLSFMVMDYEK